MLFSFEDGLRKVLSFGEEIRAVKQTDLDKFRQILKCSASVAVLWSTLCATNWVK